MSARASASDASSTTRAIPSLYQSHTSLLILGYQPQSRDRAPKLWGSADTKWDSSRARNAICAARRKFSSFDAASRLITARRSPGVAWVPERETWKKLLNLLRAEFRLLFSGSETANRARRVTALSSKCAS